MHLIDAARTWPRTPLGHVVANLTTAALERATGALPDGTQASVIVKTLQPASASPAFAEIPPQFHAEVLADLNWLDEPRVYRSGLSNVMPDGLRLPVLHAIDDEPEEERITLWLEDVPDVTPWDLDRYRRSAVALGRLGARWPGQTAKQALGMGHRTIETLFFGKSRNFDLAIQSDDAFWSDPLIAATADDRHRDDLFRLAELMPAMLHELQPLPRGMCHGDASPHNLLEPGDGTIVAIDWSYGNVDALGSDLAQLLVGRYESGDEDGDPAPIAATILDGYCEGVGDQTDRASVQRAFATHLAVRSVFSALNIEHRTGRDGCDKATLLARRSAVARFGLDLALRHVSVTCH